MSSMKIEVDGRSLDASPGQMLIEVTDQAGIHIPRFCYHPKLSIAANCRMCLVDVERAPKPLPACATPVMDGMVVRTQSKRTRDAQNGTMEFLLINHPLDCPICDQGGECPLQDQSIEYGANASRYHEQKRQVPNDDIGPLIATWMTRCIQCTRCVRFAEEIAGVMELGMVGRGEMSMIKTHPEGRETSAADDVDAMLFGSVNSEVSGNVIELCPVGALTAKPSKYASRVWDMENHAQISPFDCVGANLNIQTLRGEIKRAVVRENHQVNGYWLADRDRYGYESVAADERLKRPLIKDQHGWREVEWETALRHAAAGLNTVKKRYGVNKIGALANPARSVEELFLLQKLMRKLGSDNVDHRLRQDDFRDDFVAPLYPGSELEITHFETLDAVLLLGSNIRKEQPLLGVAMRQAAVNHKAAISALNMRSYDFHFPLAKELLCAPGEMVTALANVAWVVAQNARVALDKEIKQCATKPNEDADAIAVSLLGGENKAIILGAGALNHFDASRLTAIASWICEHTGSKLVKLPESNSAGAWIAGCIPQRGPHGTELGTSGLNAKDMLNEEVLSAYLLYDVEPGLDAQRSGDALQALESADFVVQFASFVSHEAMNYADVVLPIAHNTENSGSYINCEGRVQASRAAAEPLAEARPGWKVLRVMGNYLELEGFEHIDLADVQDDFVLAEEQIVSQRSANMNDTAKVIDRAAIYRYQETPMYRLDATLRHASALQQTADTPNPAVSLNQNTLRSLGLAAGQQVSVHQGTRKIKLELELDDRLPDKQAYIPAGYYETSALSGYEPVTIERD